MHKKNLPLVVIFKDKANSEALIGARVYVDQLKTGIVTNAFGFYSLTLPKGEYEVLYSSVGYEVIKKRYCFR